jgi:hypothetical protein
MRIADPKLKTFKQFPIPPDLIDFLRDVHDMIECGDEATQMACGDALQCRTAYGSVTEENGDRFEFTYFPGQGVRNKWIFELSKSEIQEVAEGDRTVLAMWACRSDQCGSAFQKPDALCFYCDYRETSSR